MPGLLDFIANNLPFTPIGRGILAAREQQMMSQYRQQMMQRQQQQFDTEQQQLQAAQGAFKLGDWSPANIPTTQRVDSPDYMQSRMALEQSDPQGKVQVGNIGEFSPQQAGVIDAFAKAGQFGQAAGAAKDFLPQQQFQTFGQGQHPYGKEFVGQLNTRTGELSAAQPSRTPAGSLPRRRMTPEELTQWGFPEGTVASINDLNDVQVEYKPDIRERTDLDQRSQQGGTFLTPAGDIVAGEFLPNQGYGFRDKSGKWVPFPEGTRPVTPSTGGFWSPKEFTQKRQEFLQEQQALNRLNEYGKSVGGMNVGLKNWADSVTAKFRTALGSKELNPAEFARMTGEGQLQALLGLFRTDVVGPGVMTEFDAQRVLQALGGNIGMLQNPQVVQQLLTQLYADKMQRLQLLESDIRRNSVPFGERPLQITAPEQFSGTGAPSAPTGAPDKDGWTTLPNGVRIREKR